MKFDHQVIVLTGAASGIGKELFKILSAQPIQLAAVDLAFPQDFLPKNKTAQVVFLNYNLSQANAIDQLFDEVLKLWGKIDIFIANAGFAYYEKIEDVSWERIEKIFQVNTFSPIYSLLKMKNLNKGRDFYVCITASAMAKMGLAGYALYGATKAALDRFAGAYWQEQEGKNHLGLVYPVATRTAFFEQAGNRAPLYFPNQSAEQVARSIIKGIKNRKKKIYPSTLFQVSYIFGFLQEWLNKPYQWYAKYLLTKQ
jgi:short-subunit dehydrogenase